MCVILCRLLSFCASKSAGGRAKTTTDQQNEDHAQAVHNNDIPERKVIGDRMTVLPGSGVCAEVAIGRENPYVSYKKKRVALIFVGEWILFHSESNTTALMWRGSKLIITKKFKSLKMIIINIYQLLKFYLANSRLGHIVFRKQSYINNDRNNNPSKMQHFYQQKHKKKWNYR